MRKNRFHILATISLTFIALLSIDSNLDKVRAEPIMINDHIALESTKILRFRMRDGSNGSIELLCLHCEQGRVRLRITPDSKLVFNGSEGASYSDFSPNSNYQMISGFYHKESLDLTSLMIKTK